MSFRPVYSMLVAFAAVLLSGCGQANPYGYDPYGSAYGTGYDTGSYGSGYDTGSYGSGYDTGSSYGSGYDTGSSYGTGSTYGSGGTYGSGSTYGSGATYGGNYGENGAAYGDDAIVQGGQQGAARPGATPPVAPQAPSLSAWVIDVKEPGLLSKLSGGKIVAKVEVENPSDRTLSGKLRVRFLDNGDPTGVIQTRSVTLKPKEKVVLTFSADAWRLDDAEASVETDAPTVGGGTVADRK